jgi:glycosyltransferase involved in cell wall biosynthesis
MKAPLVCIVGQEWVHLRLPMMRRLRDLGFRVMAAGAEPGRGFAEEGFEYHQYPFSRGVNPWSDFKTARAFCELFRRVQPDVVHAVQTKPALLAPAAARSAGVPACVRTITGLGSVFAVNSPLSLALRPVYCLMQRRASALADCTVFQNADDRAFYLRKRLVAPDRQALIRGSGVDVGEFLARRGAPLSRERLRGELGLQGRRVVTLVGRLMRSKGVMEFLAAAPLVQAAHPDVEFLLVGPPVTSGLEGVPERVVWASPHVRYLGPRDDVPALLGLTDVFAFPSYREGLPRALMEAGALGLPLVATDVPGCKEVVVDGWNGRLIPPRNATALALALNDLLADPELCKVLGRRSAEHVAREFHSDRVAEAYAAIYDRLLGRPGVRRKAA